jgi:hypothetical protein
MNEVKYVTLIEKQKEQMLKSSDLIVRGMKIIKMQEIMLLEFYYAADDLLVCLEKGGYTTQQFMDAKNKLRKLLDESKS